MEISEIISKNVEDSKERIEADLHADNLIIFFTRLVEDLRSREDPEFYGRIKEFYLLVDPYCMEIDREKIFKLFKECKFESLGGLKLNEKEKFFLRVVQDNLKEDTRFKNSKVMKGRLNGILKQLCEVYLPNSVEHLEPYLLGKLISFFGGLKNLCFKPSSTIQLAGSEKALFRHLSRGESCPKYGLLYYSRFVQGSDNKGREARIIANKLAISLRRDYFENVLGGGSDE